MSILLVPDVPIDDYWVKWDPVDRRWEVSTDKGVTWRILAENPEIQTLVGLGGALSKSPEVGKGLIHFDGLRWRVREGLGDEQNLVATIEAKGGILVNPNGITAAINVICWYAPYAARVTAVKAYKADGTTSINARKNGSANHLASAYTIKKPNTWEDAGTVQNTDYATGDKLEMRIVSVSGSPTQIGVEVILQRL